VQWLPTTFNTSRWIHIPPLPDGITTRSRWLPIPPRLDPYYPAAKALGGVAYLAGTLYDLIEAPRDARAYNARRNNVALAPVIQPDHRGYGMALSARF